MTQEQERPAPCAKHCEATAFQITIKNLEAQLAQRPWVGLTDEDWDEIFGNALTIGEAIKVTEAKLKEKNT